MFDPEKLVIKDKTEEGVVKNRISGMTNIAPKIHIQIFCVFNNMVKITLILYLT